MLLCVARSARYSTSRPGSEQRVQVHSSCGALGDRINRPRGPNQFRHRILRLVRVPRCCLSDRCYRCVIDPANLSSNRPSDNFSGKRFVTTAVIPAGGLARVRDRFATYPAYGSFLDELGEIVGSLTLYAPVLEPGYAEYDYHAAYVLNPKWCQVIPLPAHPRGEPGLAFLRNYSVQFRTFLREVPQWRRALIYTPSATASLAVTAWRLTRAHPDRAVAYVWGDWQQLSAVLPQRGIARWLLNPFQRRIILRQERWLVEHADVTVVAGPALGGKYQAVGKRVVETVPIIKMGELKNPRPTVG